MSICLEVWGEYALFTRPELKVEKVSYDVMTPSAARGLVESIYYHPGLRWVIDRIHVCAPIRHTNVRRNEVKATASARAARLARSYALRARPCEGIGPRRSFFLLALCRDLPCRSTAPFPAWTSWTMWRGSARASSPACGIMPAWERRTTKAEPFPPPHGAGSKKER